MAPVESILSHAAHTFPSVEQIRAAVNRVYTFSVTRVTCVFCVCVCVCVCLHTNPDSTSTATTRNVK